MYFVFMIHKGLAMCCVITYSKIKYPALKKTGDIKKLGKKQDATKHMQTLCAYI